MFVSAAFLNRVIRTVNRFFGKKLWSQNYIINACQENSKKEQLRRNIRLRTKNAKYSFEL
jgi:hypothetical protein